MKTRKKRDIFSLFFPRLLLYSSSTQTNRFVLRSNVLLPQDTLVYACSCRSNNSAPGLQYYTQTMPTFICNELFGQCNKQKVRDAQGQQACIQNIRNRCGTVNPPKSPVKSDSNAGESDKGNTSASSSSTPTAGGSSGNASPSQSSDGSNAVTTSSSRGVAAPTMVQAGHGAAAAAAFGLLAYLA